MKYCILVGINKYPVREDEVKKIIRGMADNSVLVLESGVFSGKSINGIVRDIHAERGYYYHHELTGADRVSIVDLKVDLEKIISNNQEVKRIDPIKYEKRGDRAGI